MKLSSETLQILKNFSQINQSIQIKEGSVIRTMSPTSTLMAKASVDEYFPQMFCIFDLSKFLGLITLFDDPDLEFHDKYMTISNSKQRVNYTYCDPSHIDAPPEKEIVIPSPFVELEINQQTFVHIMKAASVLQSPEICISGDGNVASINAINSKNTSADTFKIDIGHTSHVMDIIFKTDNMKVVTFPLGKNSTDDFYCKISGQGVGYFKCDNIEYWIAAEAHSTHES